LQVEMASDAPPELVPMDALTPASSRSRRPPGQWWVSHRGSHEGSPSTPAQQDGNPPEVAVQGAAAMGPLPVVAASDDDSDSHVSDSADENEPDLNPTRLKPTARASARFAVLSSLSQGAGPSRALVDTAVLQSGGPKPTSRVELDRSTRCFSFPPVPKCLRLQCKRILGLAIGRQLATTSHAHSHRGTSRPKRAQVLRGRCVERMQEGASRLLRLQPSPQSTRQHTRRPPRSSTQRHRRSTHQTRRARAWLSRTRCRTARPSPRRPSAPSLRGLRRRRRARPRLLLLSPRRRWWRRRLHPPSPQPPSSHPSLEPAPRRPNGVLRPIDSSPSAGIPACVPSSLPWKWFGRWVP
jgi:hypothetical protein